METTFYRIVDEEFREGDANELTVNIVNNHVVAISRTLYLRQRIPPNGFLVSAISEMAARLGVRIRWLAVQLCQPRFGGVAGRYVRMLIRPLRVLSSTGEIHNVEVEIMHEFFRRNRERATHTVIRCYFPVPAVADDEVCTICLQTKEDDPAKQWVRLPGCPRHFFHMQCILPYRGENCINCRQPIRIARC
jgi:hypothetical protein